MDELLCRPWCDWAWVSIPQNGGEMCEASQYGQGQDLLEMTMRYILTKPALRNTYAYLHCGRQWTETCSELANSKRIYYSNNLLLSMAFRTDCWRRSRLLPNAFLVLPNSSHVVRTLGSAALSLSLIEGQSSILCSLTTEQRLEDSKKINWTSR